MGARSGRGLRCWAPSSVTRLGRSAGRADNAARLDFKNRCELRASGDTCLSRRRVVALGRRGGPTLGCVPRSLRAVEILGRRWEDGMGSCVVLRGAVSIKGTLKGRRMEAIRDRARLVDAAAFGQDTRPISATVSRSEIEDVLRNDGQPELVLQMARRNGNAETRTLEIDWEPKELEELLRRTSGESVTLVFNGDELERAFEADVEAHGMREAAATFAVMAAVATGSASHAAAAPLTALADGGAGTSGTAVEMVSDAASSGPVTTTAPELVSDAASSGPVEAAASSELISDAASSGPVEAAASPELISDGASSGPVEAAASPELVSDAATTGPVAVQSSGAELISDAASSGPVTSTAEKSSGGGFSISAPDASTTAAIVGGAALLITAAGFAVRGQRRQAGHPA
jgi:hypothetical protein